MPIEIKNLSKSYKNHKAINNISFKINHGEIVGFLGPNGAGKSTTMKILTNYLEEFKGEVTINNLNILDHSNKLKSKIGYLPEHNPLYEDLYVKEMLSFYASIYKVEKNKISEVIELTGLKEYSSKKINTLSKGYKQRVGLACALINDPEILILDEPTTGLDPNQLIEIRSLIKSFKGNKTVLLSTHIMQEVEAICDRVIIINKGSLVADEKLETLKNKEQQILEVEFDYKVEEAFLLRIPNVEKAENIYDMNYRITFKTNEDQRAVVFDFATANELKILKLNAQNKNLEKLFNELTA